MGLNKTKPWTVERDASGENCAIFADDRLVAANVSSRDVPALCAVPVMLDALQIAERYVWSASETIGSKASREALATVRRAIALATGTKP